MPLRYPEHMIDKLTKTTALVPTSKEVDDLIKRTDAVLAQSSAPETKVRRLETCTGPMFTAISAHGNVVKVEAKRYADLAATVRADAELAGLVAAELFPEAIVRLNMTLGTCCLILKAIQDDDWAILASLPIPNLAQEWSDDPTPEQLRARIGATEVEWTLAGDELMQEWEYFAQMEYLTALEEIIINYLGDESNPPLAKIVPIHGSRTYPPKGSKKAPEPDEGFLAYLRAEAERTATVTSVQEDGSILTNEALAVALGSSPEYSAYGGGLWVPGDPVGSM